MRPKFCTRPVREPLRLAGPGDSLIAARSARGGEELLFHELPHGRLRRETYINTNQVRDRERRKSTPAKRETEKTAFQHQLSERWRETHIRANNERR